LLRSPNSCDKLKTLAVWDVICSSNDLPCWWKAVLKVKTIAQGTVNGIGQLEEQIWKGVWTFTQKEVTGFYQIIHQPAI
jgi:hypothetical protein